MKTTIDIERQTRTFYARVNLSALPEVQRTADMDGGA